MRNLIKQLKLFKKYFLAGKAANGPGQQSDFLMYLRPVDAQAYNRTVHKLSAQNKVLKTIMYKDKQYEILQLDAGNQHAKKKLLIFAGVHGNEFAAALVIPDLLKEIKAKPKDYNGWHIRIVTPINPIGLAHGSRYNEEGYDVNRDFKKFVTTGAQVQRDAIESFNPDVLVSLHESPEQGFFMFSEGKLPKLLRASITGNLEAAKVALARKSFFHVKLKSGIWEKPPAIFLLQRLLGIHTLGYFAYKRRILTITTESTWAERDVESRKKPHLIVIKAIINDC